MQRFSSTNRQSASSVRAVFKAIEASFNLMATATLGDHDECGSKFGDHSAGPCRRIDGSAGPVTPWPGAGRGSLGSLIGSSGEMAS